MNKRILIYLFALAFISSSVFAHKAALDDEEIISEGETQNTVQGN